MCIKIRIFLSECCANGVFGEILQYLEGPNHRKATKVKVHLQSTSREWMKKSPQRGSPWAFFCFLGHHLGLWCLTRFNHCDRCFLDGQC